MTRAFETYDPDREVTVVRTVAEIPASFTTEAEEQTWWSTHELGDEIWESQPPISSDELPPVRGEEGGPQAVAKAGVPGERRIEQTDE